MGRRASVAGPATVVATRALIAALAALLLVVAPARAARFEVMRPDDPATGASCPGTNCSLRAAFVAAQSNGATEDDEVVLKEGTYTLGSSLTMPGNATTRIAIVGAGANRTFIQPVAAAAAAFRVLTTAGSSELTLGDLTLQNGSAPSGQNGGNVLV